MVCPGRWWSHCAWTCLERLDLALSHGLDDNVVLGHRLDLIISKVSSNLVNPVILSLPTLDILGLNLVIQLGYLEQISFPLKIYCT